MTSALSPEIVRVTSTHLEALVPLFDAYRVFYEQPSDPAGARAYLLERLQRGEAFVFLALDPATHAAVGFTLLYPSFSSVTMSARWVLYDLYVIPDKRREGIGRSLMEYAHQFAREAGATTVSLSTAVDNSPAQKLYESLGYERDEEFYQYDLRL